MIPDDYFHLVVFSNPLKIGAHIMLNKWWKKLLEFSNPLKIGAHIMQAAR